MATAEPLPPLLSPPRGGRRSSQEPVARKPRRHAPNPLLLPPISRHEGLPFSPTDAAPSPTPTPPRQRSPSDAGLGGLSPLPPRPRRKASAAALWLPPPPEPGHRHHGDQGHRHGQALRPRQRQRPRLWAVAAVRTAAATTPAKAPPRPGSASTMGTAKAGNHGLPHDRGSSAAAAAAVVAGRPWGQDHRSPPSSIPPFPRAGAPAAIRTAARSHLLCVLRACV